MREGTGTTRTDALLLLAILGLLVLTAGTVSAGKDEGTRVLDADTIIVVEIDHNDGGPNINIEYDVKVRNGTRVNVWFLDEDEYGNYVQGFDFYYYVVWSEEGTRSAQKDWTWDEKGTFYVVVDTMGLAGANESSEVRYSVKWSEATVSNWLDYIGYCFAAGVLIFAAFVFLLGVYYKGKEKRSPEAPGEGDVAPEGEGTSPEPGPPTGQGPPAEPGPPAAGMPEVAEPRVLEDDPSGPAP